MMTYRIYLSPHLDDVVFSCGGLIRDQADAGDRVEIWTICAGDIPDGEISPFAQSLHDRWRLGREAVSHRREEDLRACEIVGASFRHFDLPDCIYRKDPASGEFFYTSEEGIFGELAELETDHLAPALARSWAAKMPAGAQVVSPLGLGGHVDHRLVRLAADQLARPVKYYADTPYAFAWDAVIPDLLPENTDMTVFPVSEKGMSAWINGNAAYSSQVSTFWESQEEMEELFRGYAGRNGGVRLWEREG